LRFFQQVVHEADVWERSPVFFSHEKSAANFVLVWRGAVIVSFEPDINTFRTDRPGIRKVLGDLEAEIMELVWQRPIDQGTTVRDIFEVLYARRHLAYTTVMNTMTRLAKKQLLRVEKKEHGYIYYPTSTQQEFVSRFVGRILEDLFVSFSGETMESIKALQEQGRPTQAQQILDEITRRRTQEEDQ
jgi:predicted transcriptional regulator